ncbi:PH domain-containing protein [Propionispora hippei]|uniref:PH domain-containing protein n=1 Tax=Propionispora hippei DSM 15287 TaxID=1123003 RepID=A0A1M6INU1_9FIRM|nr:PH domain-containing protein [Propionispora hippei]SHJ36102.1 PH domain-containing protein [Propionispora hippei DSM 15287]
MAYQLTYLDVLQALFIPFNMSFWALNMGIYIIIGFILWRGTISMKKWYRVMLVLASVIIFLLAMFLVGVSNEGDGWQLSEQEIRIKAWPIEETADLKTVQIALVSPWSEWQPTLRTNGYSVPGLSTGWFKLRNGKKAAIFYHQNPPDMLLLKSGDTYYILAHPGVRELYMKLLQQGVKKYDLSISQVAFR